MATVTSDDLTRMQLAISAGVDYVDSGVTQSPDHEAAYDELTVEMAAIVEAGQVPGVADEIADGGDYNAADGTFAA